MGSSKSELIQPFFDSNFLCSDVSIIRVWVCRKPLNIFSRNYKGQTLLSQNYFKRTREEGIGINVVYHWGMILELSNDYFVSTQFGRAGYSLKVHKGIYTNNLIDAINDIWGDNNELNMDFNYRGTPFNQNYNNFLREVIRIVSMNKQYSFIGYNCHDFIDELEDILFGETSLYHKFYDKNITHFLKKYFCYLDYKYIIERILQ